ncbi:hypothetical protein BRN32_00165 [Xanthomonas oryzae pv. oryzae]|nr:hypothetical protein BRN32_00165 [Xanthomonas oryzae pv. oryzae]
MHRRGRRMQWAVLCVLVYLLYCCWFQVNQVALGGLHEPAFIRGIFNDFFMALLNFKWVAGHAG